MFNTLAQRNVAPAAAALLIWIVAPTAVGAVGVVMSVMTASSGGIHVVGDVAVANPLGLNVS